MIETRFGHLSHGDYRSSELKDLREVGQEVIRRAIHTMLEELSCNLTEQNLYR